MLKRKQNNWLVQDILAAKAGGAPVQYTYLGNEVYAYNRDGRILLTAHDDVIELDSNMLHGLLLCMQNAYGVKITIEHPAVAEGVES